MIMEQISPASLIPMDLFIEDEPIVLDLVYAEANHPRNIFKAQIYQSDARFWTHKDLGAVTLLVARILNDQFGYTLELKDSLRTVEAQTAMQVTAIVKANPHWCVEGPDRLLSPPGQGAHPRGMAMDVCVIDKNNIEVDMGTPFDYLTEDPNDNPAARGYKNFPPEIIENRKHLDDAFDLAGKRLGLEILPISSEWWDFRFTTNHTKRYEPLRDRNLPPQMQMTIKSDNNIPNFDDKHFEKLKTDLLNKIENLHK